MSETGIIKTVDYLRGFGFITREKGRDLFFHFKDVVEKRGVLTLVEGDTVQFSVVGESKKRRAVEIRRLTADELTLHA